MITLQGFIQKSSMYGLFERYIPADHHRLWTAEDYARQVLGHSPRPLRVLDLGCGAGSTRELFLRINPGCQWYGAEVHGSPELGAAADGGEGIVFFDGVHLPWQDNYFDLLYCHQVLEHVRRPDELLADACRVLRPGGAFAGSVSYLEPCHSCSIFNFTPYGIITVLTDAGFRITELRPGLDYCSMIHRQLVGGHTGFSRLVHLLSPFALAVGLAGIVCGLDHKTRNFLKIQFAGHLCFFAVKAPAAGLPAVSSGERS